MAAEHGKSGGPLAVSREMWLTLLLIGVAFVILILLAQGMTNVVIVILACGALVLLERTVGDWLTDLFGPVGRALVVVGIVGGIGWILLSSESRRAAAFEFLGLDTYWAVEGVGGTGVQIPPSSATTPSQPATSSGSSSSLTGKASSPQPNRLPGGAASSRPGQPAGRVRMAVTPYSDATGVRLEAKVSGSDMIEGVVEFIVNGKRVAVSNVGPDGRAVAHVADLGRGTYRVEARFKGRGELDETSSRATFQRQ